MASDIQRRRLAPADERTQLLPWRRAEKLTRCHLYWIPADFPLSSQHRQWILAFLDELSARLGKEQLLSQTFLQMKAVYPNLMNDFIKTAVDFNPFFGLSRRPAAPMPPLPDMKYVEDLQKGNQPWKFGDRMPDYCYWFIGRQEQRQRQLFLGHGGLTTIFVSLDPENQPPPPRPIPPGVARSPIFAPILKQWNPAHGTQTAASLKAPFLKKSKEFFAKGLEEDPQYPGLLYVLPLLTAADFFEQSDEETAHWFETFDVYVNESVADKGLLLASKESLTETLISIIGTLKEKFIRFPEATPHDS